MAVPLLETYAESWRASRRASVLRGMRLVADAPVPTVRTAAVTRAIVRSNPRLAPPEALILATHAVALADVHHLNFGFFCATLLQESGFSPDALSSAGAVGIAQFTLDTAAAYGVDPFDWRDAMAGAAELLGSYVHQYEGIYADPYAAALAAYDAGPGAVATYHGIPPYAETREYIADVYLRWARMAMDVGGQPHDAPANPGRGLGGL
ncbi:MAG: lytic transglycosylase domain-containing protein [Candidatus Eremiobacteraeota bacterium]|nr:lytic transglycosylase domain-containing protein [Candidatus Eremiobacteraeota bacterium]